MSIKYHQNGIGNEYGADGKLTDNWSPSIDYGNEYVKVCIRIETPSFENMRGFFNSDIDRKAFRTEAENVLKSFEIIEDSGFKVENSEEKQAYLHIHPQNISGIIRKNDVKKVAEAFNELKTCSVRWVDLYNTVYVMTDAEYKIYLDTRKAEIRKMLFEHLATTRTNKYISQYDISHYLADKIRLYRIGLDDGKHGGAGQTIDYINNCIAEMVAEGFLKRFDNDNGIYVRSINKTEQKAFKCFTA